ncbi:hypothetical protein [Pseudoneobacillus sp. C159]
MIETIYGIEVDIHHFRDCIRLREIQERFVTSHTYSTAESKVGVV